MIHPNKITVRQKLIKKAVELNADFSKIAKEIRETKSQVLKNTRDIETIKKILKIA